MGVDCRLFHKDSKDRFWDLMGAGSLIPLKQYELFLETVKYLSQLFPYLKAVICGDGPERGFLQSKIEELQIGKNIELMGQVPHDKLISIMHQAKVFLHPSSYEGFSSACLEAISAGVHVISFHKPMHKEIPNWHQVKTITEMHNKAAELLQMDNLPSEKEIPFSMQNAVNEIMSLFSHHSFTDSI
ncbi:MAG: glycosyltransferase [Chitinophagaceae bacterium]